MNAPRRWIDEGGSATPFERDLLRSALSSSTGEPPPDAQKQVWAAVLAQIPGAAAGAAVGAAAVKGGMTAAKVAAATKVGVGSAGGAAFAGTAAGAGLLKSAFIGAGCAVALLATYSVVTPPDPARPARAETSSAVALAPAAPKIPGPRRTLPLGPEAAPAPDPVPAEAPISGNNGGDPHAPSAPPDRRAPVVSSGADPQPPGAAGLGGATPVAPVPVPVGPPGVAVERETMIREESRLVSDANAALRRGDASGALAQLEQIQARFPGGVLGQEREALTIEALARSGRRAEASARATAFLQAHPTSVLAGRVQPFVR